MPSLKEKIWYFFEESHSKPAVFTRVFIILLITISAGVAIVEFTRPDILTPFKGEMTYFEYFIIAVFTIEYVLRFLSSPKKLKFLIDKYNIIDFIAVAPFYLSLGNPTALRTLRIFRLLRLARLFRVLRLYNTFKFKGTIMQKITPLVLILISLKIVLIYLENIGYWFNLENLGTLFTIIGFALGLVLSSKVSNTYSKYLSLEDTFFRMQGRLASMMYNLNSFKKGIGTKLIHNWSRKFIKIYNGSTKGCMRKLVPLNEELYESVRKLGNSDLIPHHRLAALLKEIFVDAAFILGRKTTYVPEAYDRLLQQVLLIYLVLVTLFIPGVTGLLAAILGTYLLYGLYYVTLDLDLSDDKLSLIKLEPNRLVMFVKALEKSRLK